MRSLSDAASMLHNLYVIAAATKIEAGVDFARYVAHSELVQPMPATWCGRVSKRQRSVFGKKIAFKGGLRLSWPVAPLRFTYAQSEVTGYANGPLQLLRAEALWVDAPGLQLLTIGSQERAFELECQLTCQPIVQRQLALEARMRLPELTPVVTSPYAYVRSSTLSMPQSARVSRQLSVGFGGALNF